VIYICFCSRRDIYIYIYIYEKTPILFESLLIFSNRCNWRKYARRSEFVVVIARRRSTHLCDANRRHSSKQTWHTHAHTRHSGKIHSTAVFERERNAMLYGLVATHSATLVGRIGDDGIARSCLFAYNVTIEYFPHPRHTTQTSR